MQTVSKETVSKGDNLHEMSNLLLGKVRKIFQNVVCWISTQSAKRQEDLIH